MEVTGSSVANVKAGSWRQVKYVAQVVVAAGVSLPGLEAMSQTDTLVRRTPKIEREPTDDEKLAAIAEVESWKNFSGNKDEVAAGIAKWFAFSNDLLVQGIDGDKLSDVLNYWRRIKNRADVSPKRKALGIIQQLGGLGQAASWLDDTAEAPVARRFAPVGASEAPRSPIADVPRAEPRAEIKPLQVAPPVKQTEGMDGKEIFALLRAGFNQEQVEKMWEVRQSLKG